MSEDATRRQLQQAYEMIRANRKADAQAILMPILKADEDNANAWWLLANALTDPAEIREALENVLRLRPTDSKARQMLDNLNARSPADEFPLGDTGFSGTSGASDWTSSWEDKPKRGQPVVVKQSGGGTNPLVIILAIVGALVVLGCAVCFILPTIGISLFGAQIVEQAMTQMPELQEIFETITAMPGGGFVPGNVIPRGSIEYGQTVRGTVDTFDDDGWTFRGTRGDRVTIQVNEANNSGLDPQVYLLDASNNQLGFVDDSGTNNNSELTITLPSTGLYTIRVSAFSEGGDYELTLRRN